MGRYTCISEDAVFQKNIQKEFKGNSGFKGNCKAALLKFLKIIGQKLWYTDQKERKIFKRKNFDEQPSHTNSLNQFSKMTTFLGTHHTFWPYPKGYW